MNESYDTTSYALDDDALDGLLSGDIDPSLTGMDNNPVASFFAEVRSTSFAHSPRPDPRLDEVFAGAPGAPTATTPAVRPVDRQADFEPTMINIDRPVNNPTGALYFDDTPAPTRARQNPGFQPAPAGVYRPSPFEAIANALRPTPSKLLVGVSVLLVLFISAQILWFSGSPDDEIQEVAGVETSATAPPDGGSSLAPATVASVAPTSETVPTTAPTVPLATGQTQAPAPTAATTTPTAPQIGPTTPSVPTSPTTTPTVPTSATTPTVPITDSPGTSVVAPTSSTPTSMDTVPVTEPPTPETTAPAVVVTLSPGIVSSVPANVPAGQYRARVESAGGCTVQVVNAQGNQSSFQAAVGTDIVFQLLDGSRVLIAAGCPTSYRLS